MKPLSILRYGSSSKFERCVESECLSYEVGRKAAVGECEGRFPASPPFETGPFDARDALLDGVRRLSALVEEAVTRATSFCRVGTDFDSSCGSEGAEPSRALVLVEMGGGAVAKKSTRSRLI